MSNFINVQTAIEAQLKDISDRASSMPSTLASWISEVKGEISSRVNTTKENITRYNYEGIIGKLAEQSSIDPKLIMAIICTESNGAPDADNGSYVGCMQVPKSQLSLTTNQTENAQHGIEIGLQILQGKITAVGDNIMLAVVAYNAGEGIVLSGAQRAG